MYIFKAFYLWAKLEYKFLSYKYISKKMGIMCDPNQVSELPFHKIPIRTPETNTAVFKHRGIRILVQSNEAETLTVMPKGIDIIEHGNEIENPAVCPSPLLPEAYVERMKLYSGVHPVSNPGLVSINQDLKYWRKILELGVESHIDYLSIHLYIQSRELDRIDNTWVKKKWYRKISDKWEYVKAIAALLELKDRSHKQIIVTECGVCQLTAETQGDVRWMDLMLNEVLGSRLHAACWYNYVELTDYVGKAILAYFSPEEE